MKLLLTFLFAFATPMVEAAEFFVSPAGRDDQPGSESKPFASLEKARDAVRSLRQNSPEEAVTVWLMAGVHPRKTSFELTSADIGTTYRAKEPGMAVLNAAIKVPASAWKLVPPDNTHRPEQRKPPVGIRSALAGKMGGIDDKHRVKFSRRGGVECCEPRPETTK